MAAGCESLHFHAAAKKVARPPEDHPDVNSRCILVALNGVTLGEALTAIALGQACPHQEP